MILLILLSSLFYMNFHSPLAPKGKTHTLESETEKNIFKIFFFHFGTCSKFSFGVLSHLIGLIIDHYFVCLEQLLTHVCNVHKMNDVYESRPSATSFSYCHSLQFIAYIALRQSRPVDVRATDFFSAECEH